MIARLSSLSSEGQPTAFHQLLRTLDDRGQLLRVYTQNIDALEMKAGLSFGVPEFDEKKLRVKLKGKARVKAKETGSGAYNARLGGRKQTRFGEIATTQHQQLPPPHGSHNDEESPGAGPSTPIRRVSSPSPVAPTTESRLNIIPRCIPLHGTLLTLHCQHCTQSFPLDPQTPHQMTSISPSPSPDPVEDDNSPMSLHSLLSLGTPPPCPSCTSLEQTRALVGKRLRGVGKLRPSVVLYGEDHREGEGVGEAVRRDLCGITDAKAASVASEKVDATHTPTKSRVRAGRGPDLLLVVGTSLRVPGTKRIVREFSKAVRPSPSPASSRFPTPTPSPPAANAANSSPDQIRTVYLNLEFPLPSREWEGVFDVWLNGDVQEFAKAVASVIQREEEEQARKKELSMMKRDSATREKTKTKTKPKNAASGKAKGKRKEVLETPIRPSKRRKVNVDIPPTPISLPKALSRDFGHVNNTPPTPVSLPKTVIRDFGHMKDTRTDPPPCTPMRRVILRLPPPPPTPTTPTPLKRKRSIPEVVITSKSGLFSRKPLPKARSLSPLTSLSSSSSSRRSSLTPLPTVASSRLSNDPVDFWRGKLGTVPLRNGSFGDTESSQSEEDDTPLSKSFPRTAERCFPQSWQRQTLQYACASEASGVECSTSSVALA